MIEMIWNDLMTGTTPGKYTVNTVDNNSLIFFSGHFL